MTVDEFELRWSGGKLNLQGWNEGPNGPFRIETLPSGTDWGNPEPFRRALRRYLLDGSTSVKEYDDNRDVALSLRVTAPDGAALAGGEIPLALTDTRQCELVWTPKDNRAPAVLFVAVAADLRRSKNDSDPLAESRRRRYYTLSLDCLPYAFSTEYVEIPALVRTPSTPTLIDDGSSTTGWAASAGTLATSGGVLSVSIPDPAGVAGNVTMTRTGTIDFSAEPYLRVAASKTPAIGGSRPNASVLVDGTWRTLVRVAADGAADIFDASDHPTASALRLDFSYPSNPTTSGYVFAVDSLHKQATVNTGTGRQQLRTLEVPGSRRTSADIVIDSPSGADLSTVVVYTGPDYDPAFSRGAQSERVAQAGTFTGTRTDINGGGATQRFRVPVSEIPAGDYVLWAHARTSVTTPGTLTIGCRLLDESDTELAAITFATVTITTGTPSYGFKVMPFAAGTLPPWNLPAGSPHELELTFALSGSSGTHFMSIDELWAVNMSEGSLTIVEAGTASRVALTPPSLETDAPSVLLGEGAAAIPASLTSQLPAWSGTHVLEPGVTYLLTAALGASDAEASARFRPASHTHPAS